MSPAITESNLNAHLSHLLKCPICLSAYKKPKTITCKHTFCQECLKDLQTQTQGRKKCPVCRVSINFSKARLNKDLGILAKYLEEQNIESKTTKKSEKLGKVMQLVKKFEDQLEFSETEKQPFSDVPDENISGILKKKRSESMNENGQPKKLAKKDKKNHENELTPDESEESSVSSSSEDEGTTRDLDSSELEESETDKSETIGSDSDTSSSSENSDSDSAEESESGTEEEEENQNEYDEPTTRELDNTEKFKAGQKVEIFPDEGSFRKADSHFKAEIYCKTKITGIGIVYGVVLTDTSSRGLSCKLTKKQEKDLSEKEKKWWIANKKTNMFVEHYRVGDARFF